MSCFLPWNCSSQSHLRLWVLLQSRWAKPLNWVSQQREGKKADYTASSVMGDTEVTNCQSRSQQINAATRQNKATTCPLTSSKINADIMLGIKESFQSIVEKSHFQIRSPCLVTWKYRSGGRGNGGRSFSKDDHVSSCTKDSRAELRNPCDRRRLAARVNNPAIRHIVWFVISQRNVQWHGCECKKRGLYIVSE